MKKELIICLCISVILMISCNTANTKENKSMDSTEYKDKFRKDEPLGKSNDIIKLSKRDVEVSNQPAIVVVTTEGRWWWVSEIKLNGEYVDFGTDDTSTSDFMIKKEHFSIERKNTTELKINLSENTTSEKRILHIGLQAGNYFDNIDIIQLP